MSKLQAIIKKEIPVPEGFAGTILKGHTVIDIFDKLPPEYDYLRWNLQAEWGSGNTGTGLAEISTDLSGRPLRNFKLRTAGEGKMSTGWVNVSLPFLSVNVVRTGDDIHVTIYKATVAFPTLETELLWKYEGHKDFAVLPERKIDLPIGRLDRLQPVLEAAILKSQCYHCHCLHFYGSQVKTITRNTT